jgi:hypothetical protein
MIVDTMQNKAKIMHDTIPISFAKATNTAGLINSIFDVKNNPQKSVDVKNLILSEPIIVLLYRIDYFCNCEEK